MSTPAPVPAGPVRPRTRKQSSLECSLENKTVFDNALFHGLRRVYCSNLADDASIIGFFRSTDLNKVAIAFSNSTLTIWNVTGYPDLLLTQSITGFRGWIQHCLWSQCDNFLVVVSEALLYVYHRNKQNGNFEKFASFKPHDSAVSGVCFVKSDVWLDPEEVETNFSAHKTCGYSFQTCAYDGTIGKWYMQDIIDGKFQSKENSNITKEPGKWDSTIMSYHTAAVKCLHLWGVKQDVLAKEDISPKLGHKGKVTCIDGDPAGLRVISGGVDRLLLLWDTQAGIVMKVYAHNGYHEAAILSVKWSYEKDLFASCSADASVFLWSTKYDLPLLHFRGHHLAVDSLVFINSHKMLSSGRDGFILVWDIRSGGVVDTEKKHGREVVSKTYLQKMTPKIAGWINAFCCTPEGLDIVVLTSNMRASLALFSPKYTDPEWLKLPFHKKVINFFTRHLPSREVTTTNKTRQQLIKNYNAESKKGTNHMVRAPRWNEMEAKKKLIRTESWSWNQHLIDYGDSLSRRKPPNQRKMSVLQTLRRRLSVTPVAVSKDEKQQGSGTGTGTWAGVQPLLGRGYSSVFDPNAMAAPKLHSSISAVFDPMILDTTPEQEDDTADNSTGWGRRRKSSMWALMDGMDELDACSFKPAAAKAGASSKKGKNSKIHTVDEE